MWSSQKILIVTFTFLVMAMSQEDSGEKYTMEQMASIIQKFNETLEAEKLEKAIQTEPIQMPKAVKKKKVKQVKKDQMIQSQGQDSILNSLREPSVQKSSLEEQSSIQLPSASDDKSKEQRQASSSGGI